MLDIGNLMIGLIFLAALAWIIFLIRDIVLVLLVGTRTIGDRLVLCFTIIGLGSIAFIYLANYLGSVILQILSYKG